MPSDFLIGVAFAFLAASGLATQSLAVRIGTRSERVTDAIAVVFCVNLVFLLPIAGAAAYPSHGLTWTAVGAFAVSGIIGSLIARALYYTGISRLGASRAEPLKSIFPLFAVLAAVVFLNETVSLVLLAGTVILLAGGLAVTVEARDSPVTSTGSQFWTDVSLPLLAAVFLGIDPIFTKTGLAEGTHALVAVTVRIGTAASVFVAYLLWRRFRESAFGVEFNRWLVFAGVANTVYLVSYYAALDNAPVSVVTPILGISTLLVVVVATFLPRTEEHVTWRLVGATLVIVVGVAFVVQG